MSLRMPLDFVCVHRRDGLAGLEKGPHILHCFSVCSLPCHVSEATHVRLYDDTVIPDEVGTKLYAVSMTVVKTLECS